ncbi:MAG TPA: CHAT domain-containing tetratricopeptide repeat protein [Candidatus Cybelea sp.]|nr:CHAT domain-containing tetratricopeptide repeat protein [Candidatus Cybelea sp.]
MPRSANFILFACLALAALALQTAAHDSAVAAERQKPMAGHSAAGGADAAAGGAANSDADDSDDDSAPLPARGPLVPPPRTIDDITKVLDTEKPDPNLRAEELAKADAQPGAELKGEVLAKFYLQRAFVARRVGRSGQETADLHKAIELAPGGVKSDIGGVATFALGFAEIRNGSFANGIALNKEAIANLPPEQRARAIIWGSQLARTLAFNGDLDGADAVLRDARKVFRSGRKAGPRLRGFMFEGIGAVDMAEGNYAAAEDAFRRAIAFGERDQGPTAGFTQLLRQRYLAVAIQRQGRLVEAEIEMRQGLNGALKLRGRYSNDTAGFLKVLASLLGDEGRFVEAESMARATLDIYKAGVVDENSNDGVADTQLILANALMNQGKANKSVEIYQEIAARIDRYSQQFQHRFANNTDYALVLVRADRAGEAIAPLENALKDRRKRFKDDHIEVALARGTLGFALMMDHQLERALEEYRAAVPTLLKQRMSADPESTTGRDRRAGALLDGYIRLLVQIHGTPIEQKAGIDAASEAFVVAEAVRSQGVQRAIADAAARNAPDDPELAKVTREQQDADKEYAATSGLLAQVYAQPSSAQDPATIKSLTDRLEQSRETRDKAARTIEERYPKYAELVRPRAPTIKEIQTVLRPGESLIAYYVTIDETVVWGIRPTGAASFAVAKLGRQAVADKVALVRASLEGGGTNAGAIQPFDAAAAYDLYRTLLEPVAPAFSDAKMLFVVPHHSLGYLPFSLLPTADAGAIADDGPLFSRYRKVAWLAERSAVAVLPSVATLTLLRSLPKPGGDRAPFVGFADPLFNTAGQGGPQGSKPGDPRRGLILDAPGGLRGLASLPPLPDTALEVRSIAAALHADAAHSLYLGAAASKAQVQRLDLSRVRVVEFATHGLLPGEIAGLTQPALAMAAPETPDPAANDAGLLTMGEILALKLNADWVVLSACNTAAGAGAGAEALSGLGRAFFYAGSRSLLVSNWSVYSAAARELTTKTFAAEAKNPALPRAEALRLAMIELIRTDGPVDPKTGKPAYAYAHPVFWAPFSLIGDGGN